jgi:hypothetical protein
MFFYYFSFASQSLSWTFNYRRNSTHAELEEPCHIRRYICTYIRVNGLSDAPDIKQNDIQHEWN